MSSARGREGGGRTCFFFLSESATAHLQSLLVPSMFALRALAPHTRRLAAVGAAAVTGAIYTQWPATAHADAAARGRLDPDGWTPFSVTRTAKLTHDTVQVTLKLEDARPVGEVMPPASCLVARLPVGAFDEKAGRNKYVVRAYTPVNAPSEKGAIDLVVKVYTDGKLTPHLAALRPGDSVELKGAIAKLPFTRNRYDHVACVAGGTGITPMLQIMRAALADKNDRTRFTVLYGSVSPNDIICKTELDTIAAAHPGRVTLHYTTDVGGRGWSGRVGRIDKDWLQATLPPPGAPGKNLITICGPPPMLKAISGNKDKETKTQGVLSGALKELGYTESDVFKF